jgi:hypothetical protein
MKILARDADVDALATRIDTAIAGRRELTGQLIRIVRG